MSADILEREHHSSPWSNAVAELVGISRMVRLGGIDLIHPHRYFIPPKKLDIKIPEGTEHIAILIPGFMGPGTSLDWLANKLSKDGVYAITWGDHTNFGPFPHIIDNLFELIKEVSEKSGKKVVLIGHSLGGSYASHANHMFPEYVEGAITLGSPIQTTLEGLADATVMGRAATLLANEYVHFLLHEGIVTSWGPESAKEDPEGYRLAVAASLDTIVDSFACLLNESDKTRNVIVKSDHCGLPTNELVVRMIDKVIRSGNVHIDFGEKINQRLLDFDDLEKVNGLPSSVKVFNHFLRGHRRRMKQLTEFLESAKSQGIHYVSNAPRALVDATTRPLLDPIRAEENADPETIVFPTNVVDLDSERSDRVEGTTGSDPSPEIAPVIPHMRNGGKVASISDTETVQPNPGTRADPIAR